MSAHSFTSKAFNAVREAAARIASIGSEGADDDELEDKAINIRRLCRGRAEPDRSPICERCPAAGRRT